MLKDTRTGPKISDSTSHGVMNTPQSTDLNLIEAAWDQLDREQDGRQPTS